MGDTLPLYTLYTLYKTSAQGCEYGTVHFLKS